jgi:hypothetical protein
MLKEDVYGLMCISYHYTSTYVSSWDMPFAYSQGLYEGHPYYIVSLCLCLYTLMHWMDIFQNEYIFSCRSLWGVGAADFDHGNIVRILPVSYRSREVTVQLQSAWQDLFI